MLPLLLVILWVGGGFVQTRAAPALVGKRAPEMSVALWVPAAPAQAGKVVLLDFWATWCAPCIAQFPTIREWKKRFGEDLVVIGLTNLEGQTLEQVRTFTARENLPWPVAIDNEGRTHQAFGVRPLPHSFLIDRSGVVRATHLGGVGFGELLPYIEQLIAER